MSETRNSVSPSLTPEQCRMARGALRWTLDQAAAAAGVAHNTVLALEQGRRSIRGSSVHAIRTAFEKAGVRFEGARSVTLEAETDAS